METVEKPFVKSTLDVRIFLQSKVKAGNLKAFVLDKGVLLPVSSVSIDDNASVILEDPKTGRRYSAVFNSQGGMFYDDGDSQTLYYNCTISLLKWSRPPATLEMHKADDWTSGGNHDYVRDSSGKIVLKGKTDPLLEEIMAYASSDSH